MPELQQRWRGKLFCSSQDFGTVTLRAASELCQTLPKELHVSSQVKLEELKGRVLELFLKHNNLQWDEPVEFNNMIHQLGWMDGGKLFQRVADHIRSTSEVPFMTLPDAKSMLCLMGPQHLEAYISSSKASYLPTSGGGLLALLLWHVPAVQEESSADESEEDEEVDDESSDSEEESSEDEEEGDQLPPEDEDEADRLPPALKPYSPSAGHSARHSTGTSSACDAQSVSEEQGTRQAARHIETDQPPAAGSADVALRVETVLCEKDGNITAEDLVPAASSPKQVAPPVTLMEALEQGSDQQQSTDDRDIAMDTSPGGTELESYSVILEPVDAAELPVPASEQSITILPLLEESDRLDEPPGKVSTSSGSQVPPNKELGPPHGPMEDHMTQEQLSLGNELVLNVTDASQASRSGATLEGTELIPKQEPLDDRITLQSYYQQHNSRASSPVSGSATSGEAVSQSSHQGSNTTTTLTAVSSSQQAHSSCTATSAQNDAETNSSLTAVDAVSSHPIIIAPQQSADTIIQDTLLRPSPDYRPRSPDLPPPRRHEVLSARLSEEDCRSATHATSVCKTQAPTVQQTTPAVSVHRTKYVPTILQGAQPSTVHQGLQPSTVHQGLQSSNVHQGLLSSTIHQGLQSSSIHQGLQSSTVLLGAQPSTVHQGAHSLNIQQGAQSSTVQLGAQASAIQFGARSPTIHLGTQSPTAQQVTQYQAAQQGNAEGAAWHRSFLGTGTSTQGRNESCRFGSPKYTLAHRSPGTQSPHAVAQSTSQPSGSPKLLHGSVPVRGQWPTGTAYSPLMALGALPPGQIRTNLTDQHMLGRTEQTYQGSFQGLSNSSMYRPSCRFAQAQPGNQVQPYPGNHSMMPAAHPGLTPLPDPTVLHHQQLVMTQGPRFPRFSVHHLYDQQVPIRAVGDISTLPPEAVSSYLAQTRTTASAAPRKRKPSQQSSGQQSKARKGSAKTMPPSKSSPAVATQNTTSSNAVASSEASPTVATQNPTSTKTMAPSEASPTVVTQNPTSTKTVASSEASRTEATQNPTSTKTVAMPPSKSSPAVATQNTTSSNAVASSEASRTEATQNPTSTKPVVPSEASRTEAPMNAISAMTVVPSEPSPTGVPLKSTKTLLKPTSTALAVTPIPSPQRPSNSQFSSPNDTSWQVSLEPSNIDKDLQVKSTQDACLQTQIVTQDSGFQTEPVTWQSFQEVPTEKQDAANQTTECSSDALVTGDVRHITIALNMVRQLSLRSGSAELVALYLDKMVTSFKRPEECDLLDIVDELTSHLGTVTSMPVKKVEPVKEDKDHDVIEPGSSSADVEKQVNVERGRVAACHQDSTVTSISEGRKRHKSSRTHSKHRKKSKDRYKSKEEPDKSTAQGKTVDDETAKLSSPGKILTGGPISSSGEEKVTSDGCAKSSAHKKLTQGDVSKSSKPGELDCVGKSLTDEEQDSGVTQSSAEGGIRETGVPKQSTEGRCKERSIAKSSTLVKSKETGVSNPSMVGTPKKSGLAKSSTLQKPKESGLVKSSTPGRSKESAKSSTLGKLKESGLTKSSTLEKRKDSGLTKSSTLAKPKESGLTKSSTLEKPKESGLSKSSTRGKPKESGSQSSMQDKFADACARTASHTSAQASRMAGRTIPSKMGNLPKSELADKENHSKKHMKNKVKDKLKDKVIVHRSDRKSTAKKIKNKYDFALVEAGHARFREKKQGKKVSNQPGIQTESDSEMIPVDRSESAGVSSSAETTDAKMMSQASDQQGTLEVDMNAKDFAAQKSLVKLKDCPTAADSNAGKARCASGTTSTKDKADDAAEKRKRLHFRRLSAEKKINNDVDLQSPLRNSWTDSRPSVSRQGSVVPKDVESKGAEGKAMERRAAQLKDIKSTGVKLLSSSRTAFKQKKTLLETPLATESPTVPAYQPNMTLTKLQSLLKLSSRVRHGSKGKSSIPQQEPSHVPYKERTAYHKPKRLLGNHSQNRPAVLQGPGPGAPVRPSDPMSTIQGSPWTPPAQLLLQDVERSPGSDASSSPQQSAIPPLTSLQPPPAAVGKGTTLQAGNPCNTLLLEVHPSQHPVPGQTLPPESGNVPREVSISEAHCSETLLAGAGQQQEQTGPQEDDAEWDVIPSYLSLSVLGLTKLAADFRQSTQSVVVQDRQQPSASLETVPAVSRDPRLQRQVPTNSIPKASMHDSVRGRMIPAGTVRMTGDHHRTDRSTSGSGTCTRVPSGSINISSQMYNTDTCDPALPAGEGSSKCGASDVPVVEPTGKGSGKCDISNVPVIELPGKGSGKYDISTVPGDELVTNNAGPVAAAAAAAAADSQVVKSAVVTDNLRVICNSLPDTVTATLEEVVRRIACDKSNGAVATVQVSEDGMGDNSAAVSVVDNITSLVVAKNSSVCVTGEGSGSMGRDTDDVPGLGSADALSQNSSVSGQGETSATYSGTGCLIDKKLHHEESEPVPVDVQNKAYPSDIVCLDHQIKDVENMEEQSEMTKAGDSRRSDGKVKANPHNDRDLGGSTPPSHSNGHLNQMDSPRNPDEVTDTPPCYSDRLTEGSFDNSSDNIFSSAVDKSADKLDKMDIEEIDHTSTRCPSVDSLQNTAVSMAGRPPDSPDVDNIRTHETVNMTGESPASPNGNGLQNTETVSITGESPASPNVNDLQNTETVNMTGESPASPNVNDLQNTETVSITGESPASPNVNDLQNTETVSITGESPAIPNVNDLQNTETISITRELPASPNVNDLQNTETVSITGESPASPNVNDLQNTETVSITRESPASPNVNDLQNTETVNMAGVFPASPKGSDSLNTDTLNMDSSASPNDNGECVLQQEIPAMKSVKLAVQCSTGAPHSALGDVYGQPEPPVHIITPSVCGDDSDLHIHVISTSETPASPDVARDLSLEQSTDSMASGLASPKAPIHIITPESPETYSQKITAVNSPKSHLAFHHPSITSRDSHCDTSQGSTGDHSRSYIDLTRGDGTASADSTAVSDIEVFEAPPSSPDESLVMDAGPCSPEEGLVFEVDPVMDASFASDVDSQCHTPAHQQRVIFSESLATSTPEKEPSGHKQGCDTNPRGDKRDVQLQSSVWQRLGKRKSRSTSRSPGRQEYELGNQPRAPSLDISMQDGLDLNSPQKKRKVMTSDTSPVKDLRSVWISNSKAFEGTRKNSQEAVREPGEISEASQDNSDRCKPGRDHSTDLRDVLNARRKHQPVSSVTQKQPTKSQAGIASNPATKSTKSATSHPAKVTQPWGKYSPIKQPATKSVKVTPPKMTSSKTMPLANKSAKATPLANKSAKTLPSVQKSTKTSPSSHKSAKTMPLAVKSAKDTTSATSGKGPRSQQSPKFTKKSSSQSYDSSSSSTKRHSGEPGSSISRESGEIVDEKLPPRISSLEAMRPELRDLYDMIDMGWNLIQEWSKLDLAAQSNSMRIDRITGDMTARLSDLRKAHRHYDLYEGYLSCLTKDQVSWLYCRLSPVVRVCNSYRHFSSKASILKYADMKSHLLDDKERQSLKHTLRATSKSLYQYKQDISKELRVDIIQRNRRWKDLGDRSIDLLNKWASDVERVLSDLEEPRARSPCSPEDRRNVHEYRAGSREHRRGFHDRSLDYDQPCSQRGGPSTEYEGYEPKEDWDGYDVYEEDW